MVTGASSGIGREYALQLAAAGYDVILVSNREEENRQVADEIARRCGVAAWPLYADLAEEGAAERIHAATEARGWQVGVLVCNAGMLRFGLFTDENPATIAALVTLHCTTPAQLCRLYGAVDTPFYRLDAAWRRRLVRWGVMSTPREVAKKGLRALFRGRSRCIPGLFTKTCVFLCRLLPPAVIRAILRLKAVQRLL